MDVEYMQDYQLHLHEIDHNPAGDFFMAMGPELAVPEPYRAYSQVFSEADSESMSRHGL
jgi:hypothetical protein